MADRTPFTLTTCQAQHLVAMRGLGAVSLETSRHVYGPDMGFFNANVWSRLISLGFADCKVRSRAPGGMRCAHYWLTASGVAMADSLKESGRG